MTRIVMLIKNQNTKLNQNRKSAYFQINQQELTNYLRFNILRHYQKSNIILNSSKLFVTLC